MDVPPDPLPSGVSAGVIASAEDLRVVEALRRGDETAFATLIGQHYSAMLRLAMMFVPDRAVAEEVVQETWIAVLQGIGRFEGRSSLKTWIFRILTNRAKTRAQREDRYRSMASLDDLDEGPSVAPDRFNPADHPRWPGHWAVEPHGWDDRPEDHLLSQETRAVVQCAIEKLPPAQREVITLRDIEGWSSGEVCNVLGITETNQRVLLHRARSKVRQALENYLAE